MSETPKSEKKESRSRSLASISTWVAFREDDRVALGFLRALVALLDLLEIGDTVFLRAEGRDLFEEEADARLACEEGEEEVVVEVAAVDVLGDSSKKEENKSSFTSTLA